MLYANYRTWCDENDVGAAGRPKMRDVIVTYRPSVIANRQRVVDTGTGEVKLAWGLVGIRLRTPEDDFPEDGSTPTDPVDPVPPDSGSPQEPHDGATCDGDPVNSEKLFDQEKIDQNAPNPVVESFSQNDRITGSDCPAKSDEEPIDPDDPASEPLLAPEQQAIFHEFQKTPDDKSDVLGYFPDLAFYRRRMHKPKG